MKTVYRYKVRIKLKMTAKRSIIEKRKKRVCYIIATIKNWLKCLAEKCLQIISKSFWLAFFEKYGPRE